MLTQSTVSTWLTRLLGGNSSRNLGFQITWTLLRVVAGVVMVHNGLEKLGNIESFAEAYLAYLGLPFPITLSYIAAYTELIGAPLLAAGVLVRPAALGLFGTMVVAMYHHFTVAGRSIPYLELSALYAACFLFFLINGAGPISVDGLVSRYLRHRFQTQGRQSLETVYQIKSSATTEASDVSS